jgi:xeroderma pigmentosum group C-complementing protein
MPVDPIRYIVNKRKVFEPPPNDKSNRMVYVVAIEEDGYARDVTPRYAREYGARTTKAQLGGKGKKEWWEKVMAQVTRPFRLVSHTIHPSSDSWHCAAAN